MNTRPIIVVLAMGMCAGLISDAAAESPLTNRIHASYQQTVDLGADLYWPAQTISQGSRARGTLLDLTGQPYGRRIIIDALFQKDDMIVFSTDVGFEQDGQVFADEDLIGYRPSDGSFAMIMDGSALGIPESADVDAASQFGTQAYIFSVDIPCEISGLGWVDPADLIGFDPHTQTLSHELSSFFLDTFTYDNLDALHYHNGDFWYSLDRSRLLNGQIGADHDVWLYDGNTNVVVLADPLDAGITADLVALDASRDLDGDGLTDFEELSGVDDPATTAAGSAYPLSPNGYTSSLFSVDTDADGMGDDSEAFAGTDPSNPDDFLRVSAIRQSGAAQLVSWRSVPGRTYRLIGGTQPHDMPFVFDGSFTAEGPLSTTTNVIVPGLLFYAVELDMDSP